LVSIHNLSFQEASLNAAVQDKDFCKKFWEISEKMVKLRPEDPKI
jgi:hypothetical protein